MPATKKPIRIPRKELALICSLAEDMSGCTSYMVRDVEGDVVGRDPKIVKALEKVRRVFGIVPMKETHGGA